MSEEEFLRTAPKEFLPGQSDDPEHTLLLARLSHEKKQREECVKISRMLLLMGLA